MLQCQAFRGAEPVFYHICQTTLISEEPRHRATPNRCETVAAIRSDQRSRRYDNTPIPIGYGEGNVALF